MQFGNGRAVGERSCHMTSAGITYDQWLAFSLQRRDELHCTWNVYQGENIHIPREAGRRLQRASTIPIVRVRVGIWHGGSYILNPEVASDHLDEAPPWLDQIFDGFRVGYIKHDPRVPDEDDDLAPGPV